MTETAAPTREQLDLAPLPPRVENEENEIEAILKRTTEESLDRAPNITVADVKRILEARLEIIQTIRSIAIKVTAPEDWTLYRARDGSVVGVPTAAGALKMRRWAGVSIMNHRGMEGGAETGPTVREISNSLKEKVTLIEGYADGICGRDRMPAVYFSVRSDDDFIGRASPKNNRRPGGPREQDLMSCWRTGIDSKIVRAMTGTTKVSEIELKAQGIDVARCVKGSGFGNAQERAAGSVAEGGVKEASDALWNDILKATHGDLDVAAGVLVDCTKRPKDPKKAGDKGFDGFRSPDRFTQLWQVENARKKFESHEVFGREPQGR